MPCLNGGSIGLFSPLATVSDWAGIHPYVADGKYVPINGVRDLVAIVQNVESEAKKAKAVGSIWSLSRAPDSDNYVIDTKAFLNRHLSQPFSSPSLSLAPTLPANRPGGPAHPMFRSTAHNAPHLAALARDGFPAAGGVLVHVEAGVQIRQLLEDLAGIGLGLPTMGAGAGQTLAGALSTATHGSDVALRPLADAVRALHLVGPGGQEWWIEGDGGAGGPSGYGAFPAWCDDTKVIRDSDFLQSVVVSVGRFGIIYSIVLEVIPQYRLEERTHESTWADVRSKLLSAVSGGYTTSGEIFNDPLDGTSEPLRFWNGVIDTATRSRTWVRRRWRTSNQANEGLEDGFDMLGFFCSSDAATNAVVFLATNGIVTALITIAANLSAIPFVGPFLAAPYFGLAGDLLLAATNYESLGEFVGTVIDRAKHWDLLGFVEDLITEIWGSILASEHEPPLRRGLSHRILDTHNYNLDGCFSVNSSEFFFDAASTSYVQYVDKLMEVAEELSPLAGIVALRFTRETTTKLGMQRFPFTAAIEVAVQRPGSDNAAFMSSAHALALAHGGIPHWGQEHTLTSFQVEALYERNLEPWRWALAETDVDIRGTFSSNFTRARGLEAPDTLSSYRSRRYIGAILAGG